MWSKPIAVYIGSGKVLAHTSATQPSIQAVHCKSGQECDALESLMKAHPSRRFELFLGWPWVRLAAVKRIPGVWRGDERDRAAAAKLGVDERLHAVVTADAAFDSAWMAHVMTVSMREKLGDLAGRYRGRIGKVRAFASVLASELAEKPAQSGLLAVMEGSALTWMVRTGTHLNDAGSLDSVDRERLPQECARLAMRYGVPLQHVRAFSVNTSDRNGSQAPFPGTAAAIGFASPVELAMGAGDAV